MARALATSRIGNTFCRVATTLPIRSRRKPGGSNVENTLATDTASTATIAEEPNNSTPTASLTLRAGPIEKGFIAFDRGLSVPKSNSQINEDCFFHSLDGLICAVADGATISYDSAAWARFIASKAIQDPNITRDWVSSATVEFNRSIDRDSLAWMQQAAFDRGSFSTLAVVRFDKEMDRLDVFSFGDSNVFVIANDELQLAFPYTNVEQFMQSPVLLSSRDSAHQDIEVQLLRSRHSVVTISNFQNPLICIATDALSAWILSQEHPAKSLSVLTDMNDSEFAKFVVAEREAGRMRIDDTTLLVMKAG